MKILWVWKKCQYAFCPVKDKFENPEKIEVLLLKVHTSETSLGCSCLDLDGGLDPVTISHISDKLPIGHCRLHS